MAESDVTLTGGCLCGAVRFTYDGPLGGALGVVTRCHCAQCLKAQGGPAAVAPALASAFRVTSGAEAIREFESSPGKFRAFCGRCGSPLYSRRASAPDALRLRLGAVDELPAELRIEAEIFTAKRAPWDCESEAPSFPGLEPQRS